MPRDTEPGSPTGIEAEVEEQFEANSAQAQQVVGGSAPEATEPLQPDVVNSLGQVLVGAVSSLSGGQIQPPELPEIAEPVPMVPGPVWAGVVTLSTFMDQAAQQGLKEAEAHAGWDLEALGSTNAGLEELTVLVDNVGRDKGLATAMKQPAPAASTGEGSAPPPAPAPGEKNSAKAKELLGG